MIQLDDVGKDFGDFTAVESLSLRVASGEIFGFLGPNGAGKTTTIRMMTGLLAPSRGCIGICGHRVDREPHLTKRVVGYIPDSPFVYEKLTGREYIAFVAGLWDLTPEEAVDRAQPFLERFKLLESQDELIEGYSHGMKQKLVMTAAFVHEPEVLIVDEPTVGLDPRSVLVMKDMLRELAAGGGCVFLSSHSLDVAESTCDTIGILHNGKLIALGTMEHLRSLAQSDGGNLEQIFLTLTEENF